MVCIIYKSLQVNLLCLDLIYPIMLIKCNEFNTRLECLIILF